MTSRPLRTTAVALASLSLALVGCSGAEQAPVAERAANVVQPGAPGQDSRVLGPSETPSIAPDVHTDADVEFMTQMVGHHAQAIVMTSLVEDRSDNEQLELFVERMDITQVAEIEQMQDWLQERDEEVPAWDPVFGEQGGHSGGMAMTGDQMPGMATEEQLAALGDAEGEEFDRMFLELMTQHHLGAITMVRELYEAGGGSEQTVFQLASHIESDQNIELDRMAGMLADLDA